MRILTLTNMYPTQRNPQFGIFVREQVASIRNLGHDVDVVFMNGREGRLRHKGYLTGLPSLWKAMQHKRYDVLHAHYVFSGVVGRLQWSLPLVLTHHGPELRDPLQGPLCRWTKKWPSELIVVADWMVPELGASSAHVIPCGIDLDLFRPRDRMESRRMLGLDPDKRYVLFAGNTWDLRKRFDLVNAATNRLITRHQDVELIVVCQQPHDLIPLYMNACDVFAMTSTCEGSAQVVKEAMACNLPVVATNAGDNWEVIDGTDGCYRTSDDPAEISVHLEAAISPARRTNGREHVRHFALDATARRVVSVYESALAKHSIKGKGRKRLEVEVP